jgi:hypothetical protein
MTSETDFGNLTAAAASRIGVVALAALFATTSIPSTIALAQINPLDKQSTSQGAVCPLSDEQIQKSIDAFAKIVPTLTEEPRCLNCHGGVDPFAKPTNHGGDTVDPATDCDDCHSELPAKTGGAPSKWRLATPQHFFKNKDAKTLCKQMRDVFKQGADFIGHLVDDNGNSKFTEVAFLGTRGLNDRGRNLVDNYHDEPPQRITQGGLINFGTAWIEAMGGEFKGDLDCGCEPSHFAARVSYEQTINTPFFQGVKKMGPVDIPIKFHDDGSFEGEQTVYINGDNMGYLCTSQSRASMTLRVNGKATEEWQKNQMHLQLESGSPLRGSASAQCPAISRNMTFAGGSQSVLEKDVQGRIGDSMMFKPSVGLPGIDTVIRAEIVKAGAP